MKTKIFCHGVLKNPKQEILFLKRNISKIYGGLWDLPGGKLESNENYYDCLVREFKEETNIDIEVNELLDVKSQLYNGNIIIVLIFLVNSLNSYNIKLSDEHTDYIFQKEIKSGKSIWYLNRKEN